MKLLLMLAALSAQLIHATATQPQCALLNEAEHTIEKLIGTYQNTLGIYHNPFAFTHTVDEANTIYDAFLKRSDGIFCTQTPLFKIQQELRTPGPKTYNTQLVSDVITDSNNLLTASASITDLQSNLLALQATIGYVKQFECVNSNQDTSEQNTPKKDGKQESQNEQNQSQTHQPETPKAQDEYKPHTKDLPDQNSNSTPQILVEVDGKEQLFNLAIYPIITRNQGSPFKTNNSIWQSAPQRTTKATNKKLIAHTLGQQHLRLLLPTGLLPGTVLTPGATIIPDGKGSYDLTLTQPLQKVEITLVKEKPFELTTLETELYPRPVGISPLEWPEKMNVQLLHPISKELPHGLIAKAVTAYISTQYVYSTQARPETDPIEALKAGAFQCDMAAYIAITILRDVYKVPCRVVGGFTGAIKKGETSKSYVLASTPRHAWIEVFHDGAWHAYDSTPQKKDIESKEEEKSDNEFQDIPLEDSSENNNADEPQEPQNTADKKEKSKNKSAVPAEPEDKSSTDTATGREPIALPDVSDLLSKIVLTQQKDTNRLRLYVLKLLMMETLNPLLSSEDASHKLNLFKSLFITLDPSIKPLVFEALSINKSPHEGLVQWLKNLEANLFFADVNTTYHEIQRAAKILFIYTKIADNETIKDLCKEIMQGLLKALELIAPLKDPQAEDMALLEDFKKASPLLLWKTLQRDYGLKAIGPNAETHQLANDIKKDKHYHNLLINGVYDYTNFILNAAARSGYVTTKTWIREKRTIGRDILPLQRIDDWERAVYTKPTDDPAQAIRDGHAYVLAKRKVHKNPSPKKDTEAERITIVGFDTSGSMAGQNAEFQASLIAAFVCRALGDVSPSGHHRHRVILVPFDDHVGNPIKVTSAAEALDLIRNHQRWLQNTGGGTDIQAFLLSAMSLIATAQDKKHPFEAANIVLMTDGQSTIDYEELHKARESIHRDTPLQTMFIAIGQSSPDLIKFATESEKIGAASGFYKEFDSFEINKIMKESNSLDLNKYKNHFYSSASPTRIPPQTKVHCAAASKKAQELTRAIQDRMQYLAPGHYSEALKKHLPQELYSQRSLENWVFELRQLIARHEAFREEKTLNFVLHNLFLNLEELSNVRLTDLNHYELQQLVHLYDNPLHEA